MFISLFRILFVLIVAYLAFTIFRYVLQIGKSSSENRKERLRRDKSRAQSRKKGGKVIELDEDQYKVE